jgi:hypothetical protein
VKIRPAVVAAAVFLGGLGTACANPGYDSGSTRRELVDAGLSQTQAACVVRAMDRRFGEQRLNAHDVLKASERDRFATILDTCNVDIAKDGAGSS